MNRQSNFYKHYNALKTVDYYLTGKRHINAAERIQSMFFYQDFVELPRPNHGCLHNCRKH